MKPHEGVAGIPRHGDPLMTEGGSLVASELMYLLYRAVLVGNQAPTVLAMYQKMHHPLIGDRVVVLDSTYRPDKDTKNKGVGYLIETRIEGERVWYIQYGPEPEDICRWGNCLVLAIPSLTL